MPQPPNVPPEKDVKDKVHPLRPGLTKDKDTLTLTHSVRVRVIKVLEVKSTLTLRSKGYNPKRCLRSRCVEYSQLGSSISQPEFSKLRIDNLLNGDDISVGINSASIVMPKKGMSALLLIRLINFDDASYHYAIQEKQNGAWVNKPEVPIIHNVAANGLIKIGVTVGEWREIRLVITEDGGGTPVGNAYIDIIY